MKKKNEKSVTLTIAHALKSNQQRYKNVSAISLSLWDTAGLISDGSVGPLSLY